MKVGEHLESDPAVRGGEPRIAGTRLTVWTVAARLNDGDPLGVLQEEYPHVPAEAFLAAYEYAQANPRPDFVPPWRRGAEGAGRQPVDPARFSAQEKAHPADAPHAISFLSSDTRIERPTWAGRLPRTARLGLVAAGIVAGLVGVGCAGTDDAETTGRRAAQETTSVVRTVTVAESDAGEPGQEPEGQVTGNPAPPPPEALRVTRVIDGDTIDLGNGKRIRLVQIDAPERYAGETICITGMIESYRGVAEIEASSPRQLTVSG